MEGFEIGVAHERLSERLSELEVKEEERRLADALLLERIQVLESKSHHHSEPEPEEEETPAEEVQEQEEEVQEEEVQEEPPMEREEEEAPEPIAEVPPERKHLLHRVIWSR